MKLVLLSLLLNRRYLLKYADDKRHYASTFSNNLAAQHHAFPESGAGFLRKEGPPQQEISCVSMCRAPTLYCYNGFSYSVFASQFVERLCPIKSALLANS